MKNQQTSLLDTSARHTKKGIGRRHLPMAGLVLGMIATAFVVIWLMNFAAATTSRLSAPTEIAELNEFHDKWNIAQEEFQQKVDAITKEAEQKSESILVDTSTSRFYTPLEIAAQKEFQDKWNTAEEVFQQKVNTVTKDTEIISDSIGE